MLWLGAPQYYPPEIRPIAEMTGARFFSNPRTGYVACAPPYGGHPVFVISREGRVVSRGKMAPNQELKGIDARNRPVIASRLNKGTPWESDPAQPHVFGEWRMFVLPSSRGEARRLEGPVSTTIEERSFEAPVPLAGRVGLTFVDANDHVVYRIGKDLAERTAIEPTFVSRNGERTPLRIAFQDRSITSLGNDEVCLFVDASPVPSRPQEYVPLLGIRHVSAGAGTWEKWLTVMSLRTGVCELILRVETGFSYSALMGYSTRTIAAQGPEHVLLEHDGQIFRVNVGKNFRINGPI